MENLIEHLGPAACFLLPVLLFLWLMPWVMCAMFLDQSKRQVTVAQVMCITALWSIELGSGYWFGYPVIVAGILWAGILVFIPTVLICLRIRRRRRKLIAMVRTSAKPAGAG
jgi:hypothetical protein